MNLNHLAIFHATAEAGSFTKGAELLTISQPAVSKQVSELEASLKVKLFDRLPTGVRLTEAGAVLQTFSRRLFALEQDAERALRELRGLERGRLAVGASTTVGAYLLPRLFAQFHHLYPGLELRLEIANTATVQRLLVENTLDLAVTEGFVEAAELECRVVRKDDLVLIAPPTYPLVKKQRRTLAALCREPFVVREQGSGTRAVVERALADRGLSLRPVMQLGSTEAIKEAVASGMGLAFVSRLTIKAELETKRLAVIPLVDFSIRRPLHLVQLKGKTASSAVQAFLTLLEKDRETLE